MRVSSISARTLWIAAVLTLVLASGARAGDMSSLIVNLYGGDGITVVGAGHTAHFQGSSLERLQALSSALNENVGTFSFSSSVNSFTYDPVQAVFLPSLDSLGSIVGERAETIGKGKLTLALSFSSLDYDRFEGEDLDQLSLVFPHEPFGDPAVEDDTVIVDLDVDLKQHVLALYTTYGVTDRLDVEAIVPVLRTRMEVRSTARNGPNESGNHLLAGSEAAVPQNARDHGVGLGDAILRGKYNFVRGSKSLPDLAVVARTQLPTGDENDLMGTGNYEFRGLLVASKPFGRVTPHVNAGYEVSTGPNELDSYMWAAGMDTRVGEAASVGFDFVGQHRTNGGSIGDDIIDLAVGGRVNPVDNLVLFGILQFPMNRNDGVRSNLIWTLGVEYTFL